jgi:site-specific DNA-methyltransferase (adenine-specific)
MLKRKRQTATYVGFSTNMLYYGDNLDILKHHIPNESVDLIYLDPPFNSQADYNVLFKESTGEESKAQIQAFSDFWHWDVAAQDAYDYLVSNNVDNSVSTLAEAMTRLLGKNDMTAYLFMMATRLIELQRVLKSTGSLFLHCDPTASHYLKIILDGIFGPSNFRHEIIWKRTSAHSGEGKIRGLGAIHDTILFYSKSNNYKFKPQYTQYEKDYEDQFYRNIDKDGRRWMADNLTAAGIRHGESGKPWHGIDPARRNRHWVAKIVQLDKWEKEGKIYFPEKKDGMPRFKRYLDEVKGILLQDIWTDILPVQAHSKDRLGYPTQKPLELLERIINLTTEEGDRVLDPFCGCGTAVAAAEKLKRHWIGIDITWLAVNLMKSRIKEMFRDAKFEVEGEPKDLGAAKELAKNRYQFQWWALSLIGARPVGSTSANPREGKQGADEGVDGWLRFRDGSNGDVERIVVQVKSGHIGVNYIRELRDVVQRQGAAMGIFLTLEEPTSEMVKEVKVTDPYVMKTWQHKYPKIQILTIEQLLQGIKPDIPPTFSLFQQAQLSKRADKGTNYTLDQLSVQSDD